MPLDRFLLMCGVVLLLISGGGLIYIFVKPNVSPQQITDGSVPPKVAEQQWSEFKKNTLNQKKTKPAPLVPPEKLLLTMPEAFESFELKVIDTKLNSKHYVIKDFIQLKATSIRTSLIDVPTKNFDWQGVALEDIARAVNETAPVNFKVDALDHYSITIPWSHIQRYRPILAYLKNGEWLPIKDRGPLYIIYPITDVPELQNGQVEPYMVWQVSSIQLEKL